jgi:uncharacterized protein YecE (DUF72 family)
MNGRSVLEIDVPRPMRHAIEVRHESFLDPRFIEILRKHNVALVIAETARTWPMPRDVTADFMYLRLHGDRELYRSGYGPAALRRWAERIAAWHTGREPTEFPGGAMLVSDPLPPQPTGRDVFCYFDNTDVKQRAPTDAQSLMRRLGQQPGRWAGESDERRARRRPVSRKVGSARTIRDTRKRGDAASPSRQTDRF